METNKILESLLCWKYDIHDLHPAVWALPGAWRGHLLTPGDHTQMARGRGGAGAGAGHCSDCSTSHSHCRDQQNLDTVTPVLKSL